MDEYIPRKALLDWVHEFYPEDKVFASAVINAPAADVAPVVHGRWVSVPHKLARVSSVCNRDEPYKFADINANVYDYCPNCGAKMDGGNVV